MTVFISAGHSPAESGAVFQDVAGKVYKEHDLANAYSLELESACAALGIAVKRVPTGTLSSKIAFINKYAKAGDIAIEIHFNSSNSPFVKGCETIYFPGSARGKEIATKIHTNIMKALKGVTSDRGVKEGWFRMDAPNRIDYPGDVNGDEKPLAFLSGPKCASLILEPFFMREVVNIKLYQNIVARAIAQGLNTK